MSDDAPAPPTSLLARALAVPVHERKVHAYTAEDLELVRAWLDGKVTLQQAAMVVLPHAKKKQIGPNAYPFLAKGAKILWQTRPFKS